MCPNCPNHAQREGLCWPHFYAFNHVKRSEGVRCVGCGGSGSILISEHKKGSTARREVCVQCKGSRLS